MLFKPHTITLVATVLLGCATDPSGSTATSGQGGAGGDGGIGAVGGQGGAVSVGSGSGGGGPVCDPGDEDDDQDLDGFTEAQGDCNDCDANANPDAMEVVTAQGGGTEAPADEDCDGLVDEPAPTCDAGLDLNSVDAWDAARALDICQTAGNGASWGLVSAAYVRADGTPAQPGANVGLLATFGDNLVPHSGERMLGLSSGHARDVYDVEGCGGNSCSTTGAGVPPAGFPQAVPGCGEPPTQMRDDIALEVALRAPSNASGYAFDFVFFSFEYPEFVCTPFNDQFVVVATPPPANAINGNIVFDNAANPVSVNLGFFGHCDPLTIEDWAKICNVLSNTQCPPSPSPYCPFGAALLTGTGFDVWGPSAGSTGWFGTTAPVEPGELVTLRFAIWDSSDSSLDSTVVADHFRWLATPASLGTAPIPE